jgi:hypothetical protein
MAAGRVLRRLAARPTAGCYGVLAGALATALIGRVVGDPWVYTSGGALAGLVLSAYLLTGSLNDVTVSARLPASGQVGSPEQVTVLVQSRRGIEGTLQLTHPAWPASSSMIPTEGSSARFTLEVTPARRGMWTDQGRAIVTTSSAATS